MIEAFEHESIRLGSTGKHASSSVEVSTLPLDKQDKIGSGKTKWSNETPKLDNEMGHIYQTRVANPDNYDSHSVRWIHDRILGQGQKVVDNQIPNVAATPSGRTSQILSRYLDSQATFVPSTDRGLPPPMEVVSPDEPFLSTGLTSVDRRKYVANLV